MPAQPPFLTPTRTPTTGLAAFAITYLMRSAAASVRLMTCGLGRGVAITCFPYSNSKPADSQFQNASFRPCLPCGHCNTHMQLTTCSEPHVGRGPHGSQHVVSCM